MRRYHIEVGQWHEYIEMNQSSSFHILLIRLMAILINFKVVDFKAVHPAALGKSRTSSGGGLIIPLESNALSVGSRTAPEPLWANEGVSMTSEP